MFQLFLRYYITNANNNYFYCINDIKFVKNIKDINDILDPCASDEVKNINDFDHSCQTRQLTKLNNGSYYRGRLQEQYLFWLLVTKMASGSLKTIFVNESSIWATIATPGDKIKQLRKMVNGPGCRYWCLLQYLFWLQVPKTGSGSLKVVF